MKKILILMTFGLLLGACGAVDTEDTTVADPVVEEEATKAEEIAIKEGEKSHKRYIAMTRLLEEAISGRSIGDGGFDGSNLSKDSIGEYIGSVEIDGVETPVTVRVDFTDTVVDNDFEGAKLIKLIVDGEEIDL